MLNTKAATTYEEALTQTSIVPHGNMRYRAWPDAVGGDIESGVRPRLTESQKTYMAPMDIIDYNEGRAAMVPVFDDVAV
jgi:hypothetical protein